MVTTVSTFLMFEGSAADAQLVPHELATAPQDGVGAVLRYADSIGTQAEAQL